MDGIFETEMWVRAILGANMQLMKTVRGLDKKIEKTVFDYSYDTRAAMELIVDIMERKKRLLALRTVITEMLSGLSPRRREALIRRYIYVRSFPAAAAECGMSLRGFFRLHDGALNESAVYLGERGCDARWFDLHYGGEGWLRSAAAIRPRNIGESAPVGGFSRTAAFS
jgi:hypothetical protein